MPAERYYIDEELQEGKQLSLEGLEFHHFSNVMRGKAGDRIEIINGRGSLGEANVLKNEKKRALLEIAHISHAVKPTHQVILAQATPRLNRLDFIVEKGTELGMTELWLFPGERSERRQLSESQIERLQSVTIAAVKQSGRLFLPSIVIKPSLTAWTPPPLPIYFGDLSPAAPLLLDKLEPRQDVQIIFCVGPESGFSTNELEHLKAIGATGVKLHANILRTDTAAIAALSLITHAI